MQDYPKKLCFYKANKRVTGAAMQFDLNVRRECVFLEAAKQTGERRFGWENKLIFKLGVTDASKILTVFNQKADKIDLFHDPSKSKFVTQSKVKNTALSVQKANYGYYLKLSMQGNDGSVASVQIALSEDEVIVLKLMLETAIKKIYNW